MSDFDEGYRAGMQKMREVGQRRIEELEADRKKTYEAMLKVTSIHDEVETKLEKAVAMALDECPFREDTEGYYDWWHDRRTAFAELKGQDDAAQI